MDTTEWGSRKEADVFWPLQPEYAEHVYSGLLPSNPFFSSNCVFSVLYSSEEEGHNKTVYVCQVHQRSLFVATIDQPIASAVCLVARRAKSVVDAVLILPQGESLTLVRVFQQIVLVSLQHSHCVQDRHALTPGPSGDSVILVSAAFDAIDHGILLSCLEHGVGIRGSALSCIKSFIAGRTCSFGIGDSVSCVASLICGVLGPSWLLLCSLYTCYHWALFLTGMQCPCIFMQMTPKSICL